MRATVHRSIGSFPARCLGGLGLLAAALVPVAAEVPPRTLAGQTLEVEEGLLERGNVYFVSPGRDTQLTIVSAAPLSRSVVTTSRLVGFVVTPWELEEVGREMASPLLAGAFRIPVHGLRMGHEFGDTQLWSPGLLDKGQHPEITFEILGTESVRRVDSGNAQAQFELEAKGRLIVKDRQHDLTLLVEMAFFPSSLRTMARHVGDLLRLETSLTLRLGDLGLSRRGLQDLVAEEVQVDIFLMLNTISPDRSLNPMADPGMHHKQLHFVTLLRDLGREEEAHAYAVDLMREVWKDPGQLRRLAASLLRTEGARASRLDLALKAAERAAETGGEDADLFSLMAEIHFLAGRLARAVEVQEQALALPELPARQKAALQAGLQRYRTALDRLP